MGLRSRFFEALTGKSAEGQSQQNTNTHSHTNSARENIEQQNRKRVDELKQAMAKGASREQIKAMTEDLLRSYEFNQVIGQLRMVGGKALFCKLRKDQGDLDMSVSDYESLWQTMVRAQEDCDQFFLRHGGSLMRYWVLARSLKELSDATTWEFVDYMMGPVDEKWEDFRKGEWWMIAWSFYVLSAVEDSEGPASCTSEKFGAMWDLLYSKERVSNFIRNLDPDAVAYFRCMD